MALETKDIVSLVVAALLAGILLPIGLTDLVNISNATVNLNATTTTTFGAIAPASIITLLGVVVPIVIVISVMLGFLKSK